MSLKESNSNKVSKNIIRKIFLIILLLIAVTGLVGLGYWETHKKKIIRQKLESAITKASKGLYKIKYDGLDIDEIRGTLSIRNMHISYDSAIYYTLVNQHLAPSYLLNIDIPQLNLTGIKSSKLLLKNEIIARGLEVSNPVINIFFTNEKSDSSSYEQARKLYKRILGEMRLIDIDTITIKNAIAKCMDLEDGKNEMQFTHINIGAGDIQVDSLANDDTTRIYFARNINFSCGNMEWFSPSKLYRYSVREILLDSRTKNLSISKAIVEPQLPEESFVRAYQFQTDRMDLGFEAIKIVNINTRALLDKKLIAERMEVKSSQIRVYRDLNFPRDHINRSGTYPFQMIMKIPASFMIPKADFENVLISYREKNDITGRVGQVDFYNTAISMANLTNEPLAIQQNDVCRINARTMLLKKVPFTATLLLHLGDKKGRFFVEGASNGGLDAPALNALTIPMGLAKLTRGRLNSLRFRLNGNNTGADGNVTILYNDLKIEYLEYGPDNKINEKHFSTLLANLFLKKSNPGKDGSTRIEAVHHQRDMNRSFYNLVWKSIFEGINKTIGNNKPMKRP